jgi:transcriptional antiterminator RfaH
MSPTESTVLLTPAPARWAREHAAPFGRDGDVCQLADLSSENWFCLHTKPGREAVVLAHLQDAIGVEPYLPRLRQQKRIRRVLRSVVRPLFPRYLFCRFNPALHYRMVRHTPEVVDVVHFGERPAIVPDNVVHEIKSWAGDVLDVPPFDDNLRTGDEVSIVDGPMQGLRAVILHANDDQQRVALLMSCLQYQAQVMISRTELERVG